MKIIKYITAATLVLLTNSIFSQTDMDNILKAYPSWTTNFEKRSIELSELTAGGPPKDGIPALLNPKFTTIQEASEWLDLKEPVIAVSINNFTKGYPLQILMFHEIVNDRIGRIPLLVSFCPLCYSGLVFDRTINGMAINFGVSGLLRNSDLIMYDQLTESFWQQFTGEAIIGDLTGEKLNIIPSQIISFSDFKNNYPDGLVLSKNTGFKRPYGMNPYANYDDEDAIPFLFKGEKDERLKQNEKVIGVTISNNSRAYPYSITSQKKIIYDTLNNKEILILHLPGVLSALDTRLISDSKEVGATGVFNPYLDGEKLIFEYVDNNLIDKRTKSVWSITGKCISGELTGKGLEKIHSGDYFAFAWLAFNPNSSIFSADK